VYRYTRRAADDPFGEAFRRDAPTRLSYAALAAYAFWLYAFGPALALLRAELHFSYAVLGAYSALLATGAALAGMAFPALARRLPRAALIWCPAGVATVGAGLFAISRSIAFTMLGAALLGFAGTVLVTCTQAILSERHGERRDRALTEANVGAAACAVLAPLLLGLFRDTPAGWRAAMALPAVLFAVLYLRYRHQPLGPVSVARPTGGGARLPLSCWLLATMVAVGIAVEFCPVYFGAELLTTDGLRVGQAATAMSGFYLGILGGRVGAAWLTRRPGRTVPLLWASLAVSTAGFLLFWLAAVPVLAITGLFFCGLGVANLYPLSLALALAAARGNDDAANARTQVLGGVLVVAAPYLLGSLADQLGLHAAFTMEPVLIGACALLLVAGLRIGQPALAGPQPQTSRGSTQA
jgi:MFS family permease